MQSHLLNLVQIQLCKEYRDVTYDVDRWVYDFYYTYNGRMICGGAKVGWNRQNMGCSSRGRFISNVSFHQKTITNYMVSVQMKEVVLNE
jgi:hypothetical protein